MSKAVVYIVVITTFISFIAKGQQFPMQNYTREDGLPSNVVYNIYRDSKGFLWIATDKGIAKYNGLKFEIFTTNDGLPDNEVFFFQEDAYGRLWLSTISGDLCYFKEGICHTKENTPFLNIGYKAPHLGIIIPEKDSSISIIFNVADKILNIDKERCQLIDITHIGNHLEYVNKINSNKYACYLKDKIYEIDSNGKILYISNNNMDVKLKRNTNGQNQSYFFADNAIYSNQGRLIKKMKTDFSNHEVQDIFIDKNIFFATNKGLYINDSICTLNGQNVSTIINAGNNYWISTIGNGLYKLRIDFLDSREFPKCYKGEIKYAISVKHNLFFANSDADLFNMSNGHITLLVEFKKYIKAKLQYPDYYGFSIDTNYRYFNTRDHFFLFFKNVFNSKDVHVIDLHTYPKEINSVDNTLYFKTALGVFSYDLNTSAINVKCSGSLDRVFGFAKANDNSIWYSSISDMYKVTFEKEKTSVRQPQFGKNIFKLFYFFGPYLIGYTYNNRLLACENYNSNKIIFDTLFPDSKNCIWEKMYKIDDNHILISTNYLFQLLTIDTTKAKKFHLNTIENFILPQDVETICCDDKFCYFFKSGNITRVSISSLLEKPSPPSLFFTTLKTGKKRYRIHNAVEVPFYDARNINISYTTLSLGGKDIFYQYSVSKNDTNSWHDIKGDEINLIQPGYGTYTIKIRAKTISSEYSKPETFRLRVLRPFWATWWFIALCICFVTAITIIIIRIRILYVVKKNKRAHDTEVKFLKSEFKSLNALMNPHFIFNTLNNVQSLFNENDKLAANEYLRIFADLIRQNMQNVSKELIPLQKEITLVTNYLKLEKLRFEDKLNYELNIDDNIDLSEIMIPPLLIQPLVENSIKHGIFPLKRGTVQVNIYTRNNVLYIEVRDNGVGMKAANKNDLQHDSFGLQNIKRRIQQLSIIQDKKIGFDSSEITDDTGKHLWTIVTITIPLD